MKLFNASQTRAAVHEDGGTVYRIEPGGLAEVPDDVAGIMMNSWKEVSPDGPAATNLPAEPWEFKVGPAFDALVLEHKLDLEKMKTTTGPDRPPVHEPEAPADAIDPETGHINEAKTNIHLCTYCQKEYKQLGFLRKHMREEHKV